MSPEQTGRMNRRIDARSDLYGLGALFFMMLTGRPPFNSDDVSEVQHAHIARRPPHVHDIARDVPYEVDELIDVLLRKDPEQRYASAALLRDDLSALHNAIVRRQPMPVLRGTRVARQLQWPSTVVGRDAIIESIVPAQKSDRLPRMIIIRGANGVGKTTVMRAAANRARSQGFHVGRGAYARIDRGQPASAITSALSEALSFLDALEGADRSWWQEHLSVRLRGAESIVAANLPVMQPFLDRVGPVPDLAPLDAQARSLRTMELLAGAIAPECAPMLLVIEDIQWADAFSIDLMERIVRSSNGHALTIVCSIRDAEPSSDEIVRQLSTMAMQADAGLNIVSVPPLEVSHVTEILKLATGSLTESIEQASVLIHRATAGNALAVREVVRHCGTSGIIRYDPATAVWTIDLDAMARQVMTDSSSAYLARHIRSLPEGIRQTLTTAICYGLSFSVADLADVLASPLDAIEYDCIALVQDGLLYRLEDGAYHLVHDRIIEAALAGVNTRSVAAIHHRIAASLERQALGQRPDARIFERVHHGNASRALFTSDQERQALAEKNLAAARISRQSAAFEACALYAGSAKDLINACQNADTSILHEASTLLAECRALLGDPAQARHIIDDALRGSTDPLHRADLFSTRMTLETIAGDMPTAIRNGLFALRELGIVLPSKPSNLHVLRSLVRARLALRTRRPDDLFSHPPLTEERARRALRILDEVSTSAYHESTTMIAVAGLERARLAFTYGFDGESVDAVAFYAMIITLMGFVRKGAEFAEVAELLAERGAHPRTQGRTLFVLGATTTTWTRSGADTLAIIRRAADASTRASDGLYVGYAMGHEIQNLMMLGRPIYEILESMEQRWEVVRQLFPSQQQPPLIVSLFRMQTLRMKAGLSGSASLGDDLAGDGFNPAEHVDALTRSRTTSGLCEWYWRLLLVSILADDVDSAQSASNRLRPLEYATAGQPFSIDIAFLRCLLAARQGDSSAIKKHSSIVRKAARLSPAFRCRARITDGLGLLVGGDAIKAREALIDALSLARADKNLLLSGITAEWLATLCEQTGMSDAAPAYRELAYSAYGGFGAQVAVDRLRGSMPAPSHEWEPERVLSKSGASDIDYEVVLRASASIASEIRLDGLMKTLLTLVLQHAGAQRAILLSRSGDALTVTALADADGTMTIGAGVQGRHVPYSRAVIDRAMELNDLVVVHDASSSETYASDADVRERSVRSVMALPIVHSATSPGALYLENNLVSDAFTAERAGILRLLGGHIAVALENARLYDRQQRLLDATTRFVPSEFLHHLGDRSIDDVSSGMAVRLPMTILFADIRRFTTISEELPTSATFTFLNDYLGVVEPIIRRNGGFIDKYIGDAVMSLFPGTPAQAVRAGIDIQRALVAFNQQRQGTSMPSLSVGIGIHHGEVILGTVGSSERMDTTVVGDAVNVASRLEQLTKDRNCGIIISDDVHNDCSMNDVVFESIGAIDIRGRTQPITAYAVNI
jgi:predicted ATPase/class 3 adenylate cyclase